MDRTALAAPEDCDVHVIVTGTLCPGVMVMGKEIPPSENSAPLRLADETVMLAPPALRVLVWLNGGTHCRIAKVQGCGSER